jgi:hypothetical protein
VHGHAGRHGTEVQAAEAVRQLPATTLSRPATPARPVDARGFIHRWMVLEPISVPGQLTEGPVKTAIDAAQLPGSGTGLPRGGEVVDHNGPLRWHALDTGDYNLNLYHFAWRRPRCAMCGTDFCARFLDANDQPVTGLTASLQP